MKQYLKTVARKYRLLDLYYNLYPQKPLHVEGFLQWLLLSRWAMYLKMRVRMLMYLWLDGFKFDELKIGETSHLVKVIKQNLYSEYFVSRFCRKRSEHLIYLLKSIPSVKRRGRVLSIGPKNEGELLLFKAHGFKRTEGVDLFSYSPSIAVMDMHNMTFENNTFDVICAGYVVRYSNDIHKFVSEIVRVGKNGAHVAISFSMKKGSLEADSTGTLLYNGIDELLAHFWPYVRYVYWRLEDENTDETELPKNTNSVVFSLKKNSYDA